MATLSMHAAPSATFSFRSQVRAVPVRTPVALTRLSGRAVAVMLDVAGRCGLALLPFSFLAWIFIAK